MNSILIIKLSTYFVFQKNLNLNQFLSDFSQMCLFNIHILPISCIIHTKDKYLFFKNKCYNKHYIDLNVIGITNTPQRLVYKCD